MQGTTLTSNKKLIRDRDFQGVTDYWVWTPPNEMTERDKETSDAVVECLRLFARYGKIMKNAKP